MNYLWHLQPARAQQWPVLQEELVVVVLVDVGALLLLLGSWRCPSSGVLISKHT